MCVISEDPTSADSFKCQYANQAPYIIERECFYNWLSYCEASASQFMRQALLSVTTSLIITVTD